LSRWLEARGQQPAQFSARHRDAFLHARRAEGKTHFLTARGLAPILRYLERAGVAFPPARESLPVTETERLMNVYANYLREERGLNRSTVQYYVLHARHFLCWRIENGLQDMATIQASELTSFVLRAARRYCIVSTKLIVTALRSFVRYLYLEGQLSTDLREAIPAVAGWRLAGLPKGLETTHVKRLLRSCDRRRSVGWRDYAVLLLMVRLGLRAGEVAQLRLNDIDWRSGEIIVRGKGQRQERLPLPTDVGDAIAHYLRSSRRRKDSRRVFLGSRAPYTPLERTAICVIPRNASARVALPPVGAHRLRHTAATQMLQAGGSLDEIAQVLRHRRTDTTAIYAKVDRKALRALVRPWGGGTL
jgi:site-specific recombinase XerD